MNIEELEEKKNKIKDLEKEISDARSKQKQLIELKKSYFDDYMSFPREDYTLLTDIPENIDREKRNPLFDYSNLNIDTVGKLICKLFDMYEGKEIVAKRKTKYEICENAFGFYYEEWPVLVIGDKKSIDKERKKNIIIPFSPYNRVDDYPTDKPVFYILGSNREGKVASNYAKLLYMSDGIIFDDKNHPFIKELIYSLAYYQKMHSIPFMDSDTTKDVFKKIYKK